MPKTDAAKLPIITFKPFISERGFELLANAVVEQLSRPEQRSVGGVVRQHRCLVHDEHGVFLLVIVERKVRLCSKRFSQFTALDGRALIERIRGEMNL